MLGPAKLILSRYNISATQILAVLAVLAALAVVLYIVVLKHNITSLRQDVATLTTQKDALEQNNKQLISAIDANNNVVQELRKLAPDLKKQFDAVNADVIKQNAALQKAWRKVLAEKKPLTCEDTIKYLIDANKEYKRD